jgi:hypothetical protein
MLYLDLIVSFSRLLLYATFICIMFKVSTLLKFVYSHILASATCLQKNRLRDRFTAQNLDRLLDSVS